MTRKPGRPSNPDGIERKRYNIYCTQLQIDYFRDWLKKGGKVPEKYLAERNDKPPQ